jgi:hypothetical protein
MQDSPLKIFTALEALTTATRLLTPVHLRNLQILVCLPLLSPQVQSAEEKLYGSRKRPSRVRPYHMGQRV